MIENLVERVFQQLEDERDSQSPRNYLGMSGVGHPCDKKMWIDFHEPKPNKIPIKGILAIEDGHRHEEIMRDWLNKLDGVECKDSQLELSDFNGKFKGHTDGILTIDGEVYVWEHKQSNETKFNRLKDSLKDWDATYYAQAQCYMHYTKIHRHLLTCGTPGLRDVKQVVTKYNKVDAEALVDRANYIIHARNKPQGLYKGHYMCNWCNHKEECWG